MKIIYRLTSRTRNAETYWIRLERVYHAFYLIWDISAEEQTHSIDSPVPLTSIKHYHIIIDSFAAVMILIFELKGNIDCTAGRHTLTLCFVLAPQKKSEEEEVDTKLLTACCGRWRRSWSRSRWRLWVCRGASSRAMDRAVWDWRV